MQIYIPDENENEARRGEQAAATLCCQAKGDEDVRPFITALGRYLREL